MNDTKDKGIFIVIEGGDGCGKTSQINALVDRFGKDFVVVTREPGGAPYAEKIRELILSDHGKDADGKTMFALFWASRADHLNQTIIPALAEGKIVICDRFDSSSYAYQLHAQEDLTLRDFFWNIRSQYLDQYQPDVYIYLDVDPDEGFRRKNTHQQDEINHFDTRGGEFALRMREGFFEFFEKVPHEIIDANPSFEEVQESLNNVIRKYIKQ